MFFAQQHSEVNVSKSAVAASNVNIIIEYERVQSRMLV